MKSSDFYTHLDAALDQLNAGEDLEQILAAHPAQATELRPLLEAACFARMAISAQPDKLAQNRNRVRFVSAARPRPRRRIPVVLGRLALNLLAALLLVLVSMGIGGLASVQALPGDSLYPVKQAIERAQLALSNRAENRLMLEEQFDHRHAAEVQQLIVRGSHGQNVSFAGELVLGAVDGFWVSGIPLQLSPELEASAFNLMGAYVELTGTLLPDGHVQVMQMQLRLFDIHGRLQQVGTAVWLVDGVTIEIAPQTQILGQPEVGQQVSLTALQLSEGQFLALSAVLGNAPTPTRASAIQIAEPGVNPDPVLTVPSQSTDVPDETLEPWETTDDPDDLDDSDTSDDKDETETETETVDPDETEELNESELNESESDESDSTDS